MIWEDERQSVKDKWRKWWNKYHTEEISEYTWNYLFTGGKEIRAKLFCELWNYLSPDLKVNCEIAFAVECIHAASLILDDTPWMDNANERRGRKTLHLVYTPKKAVLVAFEVMHMVMEIWLTNRPGHISEKVWSEHLKSKLEKLVVGQWYDLDKKGSLYELSSLKTGVLFELVTESVALCCGLDRDYWRYWGNSLGVLFQWMDDWNDRDEDKAQNNRNAFNEDTPYTLAAYNELWAQIAYGIGQQWFEKPFGKYMKTYFTDSLYYTFVSKKYTLSDLSKFKLHLEANLQSILQNDYKQLTTFISKAIDNTVFRFENNEEIIMTLYNFVNSEWLLNYNKSKEFLNVNLWEIDESEWDNLLNKQTTSNEYIYDVLTEIICTYTASEAIVLYNSINFDILSKINNINNKSVVEQNYIKIKNSFERIIPILGNGDNNNKNKIKLIIKNSLFNKDA